MPPNLSRKKADEMNSRTDPVLMTQTQYARHRNQSPQYTSRLAKAGVPPRVSRSRWVNTWVFGSGLMVGCD